MIEADATTTGAGSRPWTIALLDAKLAETLDQATII
jgi:hypothetical protein